MLKFKIEDPVETEVRQADMKPVRRLLVPMPELELDLGPINQRLYELARATGAQVRFLAMCKDPAEQLGLRRKLATMVALMNSDRIRADAEVLVGNDWAGAIRSHWKEGDLVVCFSEARRGLLLRQILKSNLNVPLYILSGISPEEKSSSKWKTQAAAWAGSALIILGFFVFQAWVDVLAKDWATALQLVSLPVEVWLILAWNSLFG